MLENYPDILTIKDIMDILKVGRSLAYKLLQTGKIKSKRIGEKKYLISKIAVINYIKNLESS